MTLRLGDTLIAGSGANQDLSNLTSQGQNIANWSSNVTNCITEIPQDIKVGLNNGGLYLKAGCKYCVPNGFEQDGVTPHFDFVTVNADTSPTAYGTGRTGCMAVWSTDHFEWSQIGSFVSGSTQPAAGDWWVWYDTTTNKIKHSNGSTIVEGVSFPICMITENAGTGYDSTVKSIDQVFNGFGYIGSTVYVLPGVKGLIPNGRNADGSLKNIEVVVNSVMTYTITGWERLDLLLYGNSINVWPSQYSRYTDENFYEVYDVSQSKWVKSPAMVFGFASFNSKITSFTPKTAFHALDYNDSSTISGWSMPSGRYIDLTIGASGTTYTAPANGYFQVGGYSTALSGYVQIDSGFVDYTFQGWGQGHWGRGFISVKKGGSVLLLYSDFSFEQLRFVYAEGEN